MYIYIFIYFSAWYKIDLIFPNSPYSYHGLLNDSSFFPLLKISGTIFEPCPVCWDSPWQCPRCPALQPWGCALHFSHHPPHRRSSRLEVSAGPIPRDEGGAGSWTRCIWPSGNGYILTPLTLATSQSVNCPLAKGVWVWKLPLASSQTLQRLLSEKLTWGGIWTGLVLRWFREVGAVRPSVTNDCEYIEMFNFKLGFFAPFPEYHLFLINSERSTCCRWRLGELCQVLFLALTCFL